MPQPLTTVVLATHNAKKLAELRRAFGAKKDDAPSGDDRPGWHPAESLTPREALAASVDGRRLRVGDRGDLVVLGADPLWEGDPAATHAHLLAMPVRATVCAGRITHRVG